VGVRNRGIGNESNDDDSLISKNVATGRDEKELAQSCSWLGEIATSGGKAQRRESEKTVANTSSWQNNVAMKRARLRIRGLSVRLDFGVEFTDSNTGGGG